MENYLIFDFIILFFIIVSGFFAFLRGFTRETLVVINWILALLISYNFGGIFSNNLNKIINDLRYSNPISYLLTFLIVFIFFSFLTKKISNLVKKSDIGFLDRTGGFVFGIFRGYLIICLGFLCFHFFYEGNKLEFIEKSKFNFVSLVTNKEIVTFLKQKKFAEKLKKIVQEKRLELQKKTATSKTLIEKSINKSEEIYNKEGRDMLNSTIEKIE